MQLSELKTPQSDELLTWQELQDGRDRQKRKLKTIKSKRAYRQKNRIQSTAQRQLIANNHLVRKR